MNTKESSQVKVIIQKILNEEKPKTVKKLIERTVELSGAEKTSVYEIIRELESEKTVKLGAPKINRELPTTVFRYLFEKNYYTIEFWLILGLTIAFLLTALLIQEDSSLLFLRVTVGIMFGILIPGWVITNLFFPKLYEVIDQLERVLISLGINIGILVFSGLILNQIWAIDTLPYVIFIGSVTLFFLLVSTGFRIMIGKGIIADLTQKINIKYRRILEKFSSKLKAKLQKSDVNEEEP